MSIVIPTLSRVDVWGGTGPKQGDKIHQRDITWRDNSSIVYGKKEKLGPSDYGKPNNMWGAWHTVYVIFVFNGHAPNNAEFSKYTAVRHVDVKATIDSKKESIGLKGNLNKRGWENDGPHAHEIAIWKPMQGNFWGIIVADAPGNHGENNLSEYTMHAYYHIRLFHLKTVVGSCMYQFNFTAKTSKNKIDIDTSFSTISAKDHADKDVSINPFFLV